MPEHGGEARRGLHDHPGVVAGLLRHHPGLGVLYFDGDVDLSTPATTQSGILDAMGWRICSASARPGPPWPAVPAAASRAVAAVRLRPIEVGPDTLDEVHHRGLPAWPVTTIRGRPAEAAAAALVALERVADRLLVHFDVDAIDSTDYPLANFPHFNLGQPFDSAMTCLATFCGSSRFGGLVVTEVNPDHDADGSLLAQLVNGIVAALQQAVRA
jgi:arginase